MSNFGFLNEAESALIRDCPRIIPFVALTLDILHVFLRHSIQLQQAHRIKTNDSRADSIHLLSAYIEVPCGPEAQDGRICQATSLQASAEQCIEAVVVIFIGSEGTKGPRLPTEPCVRVRTRLLT